MILSEQARRYHPEECYMPHILEWCMWYLHHTHAPTSLQMRASIAIYQVGQHLRWTENTLEGNLYKDYQSIMSCSLHLLMAALMIDKLQAYTFLTTRWDPFRDRGCKLHDINYRKLFMHTASMLQHIIDLERPLAHTRKGRFTSEQAIDNIYHAVCHVVGYVPWTHRAVCINGECEVMSGKL